MPYRLFALPLLLALLTSPAFSDDLTETADAYLDAIRSENWNRMASLLAPGAQYQDYSMEFFDRPMIDLEGPDAIVGFWRDSAADAGTIDVKWQFDERFASGPNLFLIGQTYVHNKGDVWGFPGHDLKTRFPQITHLRIVDGKVVYHADHVNYDVAGRQLTEQTEAIVGKAGEGEPLRWENPLPEASLYKTATAYIDAIEAMDWTAMANFLNDKSRYQDFSIELTTGEIFDLAGRDAIVKVWSEGATASGILSMNFETENRFVAGPNVFALGHIQVRMKGEAAGLPGREVEVRVRHILHLRIVDGKILHHTDHVDYTSFLSQIEAAAAKSGASGR